MLTIVFSTQKFTEYNLGKTTLVQTTLQAYGSSTLKIASNDPEIEWL